MEKRLWRPWVLFEGDWAGGALARRSSRTRANSLPLRRRAFADRSPDCQPPQARQANRPGVRRRIVARKFNRPEHRKNNVAVPPRPDSPVHSRPHPKPIQCRERKRHRHPIGNPQAEVAEVRESFCGCACACRALVILGQSVIEAEVGSSRVIQSCSARLESRLGPFRMAEFHRNASVGIALMLFRSLIRRDTLPPESAVC